MHNFISLGAGVQSSTLALMAAKGEVGPMPDAAIFADTQGEPASVYAWLDWLEKELPFPVYRVTKGSLSAEQLRIRKRVKTEGGPWAKSLIPAYVKNADGSKGIMGRSCTADFKIAVLEKEQKRLAGVARREKQIKAALWIGISLDEVQRMKPSRSRWGVNRWPLIEANMSRHDCLRWMERNGYPKPPRSACVYCPFHSDHEWRRLKNEEPAEFAKAVQFERQLQAVKLVTDNMRGVPFLHASLKTLDEVDFSTDQERGQQVMWDSFTEECEGMCGL